MAVRRVHVEREVIHRADGGHAASALADDFHVVVERGMDRIARRTLGRIGEPEERDAVDAVAHVEKEMLAATARQLQRLHQLHPELVLVPGHGFCHVTTYQGEVVEAT
jgi:hypothetical protein